MQLFIIINFIAFATLTVSLPTPTNNLSPRANVPSPGPIPYQKPNEGYPDQQSVTGDDRHSGLQQTKDVMVACLVAYGSGRFYDSWDGNYCGGYGWFKGSKNNHIGTYKCYQTCATWIEGDGIDNGSSDYLCDFRTGTTGHCWMGYHPASAPSSVPSANSTNPAVVPLASETASVNTT